MQICLENRDMAFKSVTWLCIMKRILTTIICPVELSVLTLDENHVWGRADSSGENSAPLSYPSDGSGIHFYVRFLTQKEVTLGYICLEVASGVSE